MGQQLAAALLRLEAAGHPGLGERLAITWLRYSRSRLPRADRSRSATAPAAVAPGGAGWRSGVPQDPGGLERLAYLLACERWLQRDLLLDCGELRGAMVAMAQRGSLEATSLVVDLLSGTTSGPALPEPRYSQWKRQRRLVNDWLACLDWPELQGCNCCQKTWEDGPYGRERAFYGADLENRNSLSTEAVARLLHAVMRHGVVSPPACERMRALLRRSLDPLQRQADPENQVDGFLGEGLPPQARLWSKAGWMSQARHNAAYVEGDGHRPMLLVALGEGPACARDEALLPRLAAELFAAGASGG